MDQVGLDQEIQRPVDCRWRHFAASTIQAIKDIVRTDRLVAVPDQLQYPPALFREAKPALTADLYGRRYGLCHAVLVIVFFTREGLLEYVSTISLALINDGADCTAIFDPELRLEPAPGLFLSDRHS
jgi:hypothetical protein